jgi:predicted flap endonuclease-1-like 5' DNA nuclease
MSLSRVRQAEARRSVAQEATVIISALVGAAVGGALGWTIRNSTDSTRTRVLEELYSRKLRLAEQVRDEATRSFNANRVEMAGFAERFGAHASEIEALRERLARSEQQLSAAQAELQQLRAEIPACREAAAAGERAGDEARELIDAAEQRALRAAAAQDQAYGEIMALSEQLSSTQAHQAALQLRSEELEAACLQQQSALENSHGAAARLQLELTSARESLACRASELEQLTEFAAELEPLRAALSDRERMLAGSAEQIESDRARIEELAAEAARLPALLAERDARGERIDELKAQLAQLSARVQTLPQLQTELRQLQEQAKSSARELERERQRGAKLEAAGAARETEARSMSHDLARVQKELAVALASLESKQRESERGAAKLAGLQTQLAERDERLRTLKPVARSKTAEIALRPKAQQRSARATVSDDLMRITGIGPVLAKKLRRVGIATFDQLAALTRPDLETLAEKLGIGVERIRREGWIASARTEARARN